jgi:methylmalonyl-CoA mutase N-terminal domain/subunit
MRRLWGRLVRERWGAHRADSGLFRTGAGSGASQLTAQQPENNVVRVTLHALAAILGGAQSLHTAAYDEALALPTEASVRLALRTQQVLAAETGVADVADPLGGAGVIEAWTAQIAVRAREEIAKIDAIGGAVAAIERGVYQREIEESAYRAQREIETGERLVVGVNAWTEEETGAAPSLFEIDPANEKEQVDRLAAFRARRDAAAAREALERLTTQARGEGNLMPPIVEAVARGATLGEIVKALKEVFGEHRPGG